MKQFTALVSIFLGFSLLSSGYAQESEDVNLFSSRKSKQTPQVNTGPATESPLDAFEFNGVMEMGGIVSVSVFDQKTNRNYWLKDGETLEGGLKLARFDADNDVAVISKGGVSKRLSLKKVQIEALKIANTPVAPQSATPTVTAANNGNATATGETDEEVRKRMQKVAEEIRRRRAERRARIEENRRNQGN